jgi:peptidoglycan/LPS O-acetylase OafA/YrhL
MTKNKLRDSSMQLNSNHRYDGVQVLRFIAALMVVITHSFFYTSERWVVDLDELIKGSRGVDIFFVISGFVMIISSRNLIETPDGWTKFAIQRITRVVPLYWVATTLKLMVMLLTTGLVLHATIDTSNIIKSYFFIPYIKSDGLIEPVLGVGWTLVFEMFFYLVFTIALLLRVNLYVFVGATMITLTGLSLLRPELHPVWMFLFDPIVLEFFFGMIIGGIVLKGNVLGLNTALFVMVTTLLFITFIPSYGLSRVIIAGIPAMLLVYSIVSVEPYLQNRIPGIFLLFGAASYSLYLFHPMILPAVPLLLKKIGMPIVGLSVSLCITSALILAIIVYSFVELPITHLFRKLQFVSIYTHKPVTEIK